MSPTHNWTITGRARSDWSSSVAWTTTAILSRAFPESTGRDWTFIAAPPKTRAFGSCSAPHPSLTITGHRANPVNRTGYERTDSFLVPPTRPWELATGVPSHLDVAPVEPQ
jgi:hypothetical protein